MKLGFFGKATIAAIVVVGAAVGIMLLFGGGDDAEVRARIAEGEAALNRHDVEACIGFIDPSYDSEGADYDRVVSEIRASVNPTMYSSVTFEDVEVDVVGETATVALRMKFKGGALSVTPFTFSLRRKGGAWMIVSIKRPEWLDR